ncbi:hypothetical protein F9278_18685 [Streptomyces phaeolivaceus]|uniref:Uncharacterized protein n=1 Tax=Streptomyces phaeolivaceus TaxID=2653200 RepID=A0A5P8K5T6_9ACTN|nr:hypothetical protein [Streptomyces phaeolivaceus]QFQ97909.1 hypothetical protein F9278_18685 [Streptomyces phaeolivaceus]
MDRKGQARLEARADAILNEAGEEKCEDWPQPWRNSSETEHERIAAAHTGVFPLLVAALLCSAPSYEPNTQVFSELMEKAPGADTVDEGVDLVAAGGFQLSGKEQPKREVWERCRWSGCGVALYSPDRPRKRGNPRKYCDIHKKKARARTQARRSKKIWVGKHRNLSYIEEHPSPVAEWFRPLLEDCYQANRDYWLPLNLPGRM